MLKHVLYNLLFILTPKILKKMAYTPVDIYIYESKCKKCAKKTPQLSSGKKALYGGAKNVHNRGSFPIANRLSYTLFIVMSRTV